MPVFLFLSDPGLQNKKMGKQAGRQRLQKKISPWRFAITYIVLMGLFLLAIGLEPVKQVLDVNGLYTQLIVKLSGLAIKPFGIAREIRGSLIILNHGPALDVRFGCNGLEAFLIYSVAILAYPARRLDKLVGIAAGFVVLQILNVLRIAALALSAIYLKEYFEYIHIYAAQGIMIAVALIIFLAWLHLTPYTHKAQE